MLPALCVSLNTFLPYGGCASPPRTLHGDTAFLISACSSASATADSLRRCGIELVAQSDQVIIARGAASAPPLPGVEEALPIDGGPFSTSAEAADLCQRWLEDYWECRRVEGSDSHSCFDFGGCHRRCWWRGTRPRVELKLTEVGVARQERHHPSRALEDLRARAAADVSGVTDDTGATATLKLHATLITVHPSLHYAGLRPLQSAATARGRRRPPFMRVDVPQSPQVPESHKPSSWSGQRVTFAPHCSVEESEARALLGLWSAVKANVPALLTGAGGRDGDDDPAGALFNMLCIRLPFLLGVGALVLNVLLGGGVAIGSLVWPPVP